jgi:hypothetical protein
MLGQKKINSISKKKKKSQTGRKYFWIRQSNECYSEHIKTSVNSTDSVRKGQNT